MQRRTLLAASCAALALTSLPAKAAATELKIACTPVPAGDILRFVKPILAKEGIDLKIYEFQDFVAPNAALESKDVDVNLYQHGPFLENAIRQRKLKLVAGPKVHLIPMAVYSEKVKKITDVAQGGRVSIPNDPTNGGRALLILQSAGLIKLRAGVGHEASPLDVTDNPKKLRFVELEAAQVPRSLKDVDLAVVNTNYALSVGLNPLKDSIFIESKDSPYAVLVATRQGDEKDPRVLKLEKVLTSPETRKFILDTFKGAVIPAF